MVSSVLPIHSSRLQSRFGGYSLRLNLSWNISPQRLLGFAPVILFTALVAFLYLFPLLVPVINFGLDLLSFLLALLNPKTLLFALIILFSPLLTISVFIFFLIGGVLDSVGRLILPLSIALGLPGIFFTLSAFTVWAATRDPPPRRPRKDRAAPSPWPDHPHRAEFGWDDAEDVVADPNWVMPAGLATYVPEWYKKLGMQYYVFRAMSTGQRRKPRPAELHLALADGSNPAPVPPPSFTRNDEDDVVADPNWVMPAGLGSYVPRGYRKLGIERYVYRGMSTAKGRTRRRNPPLAGLKMEGISNNPTVYSDSCADRPQPSCIGSCF